MNGSLYSTLGVQRNASVDEIRAAYRKLARELHPDVNPGDTVAEDRFKRVASAYDVLSDEKRRANYDEFGEDSLKGGFDADRARAYQRAHASPGHARETFDFDVGEIFGFGRARTGPLRGHDIRALVEMDLAQAIVGGHVEVATGDGRRVKVRIPPGADDGSTIRLAAKGGPGHRGGTRGDLVIETRVKPHPRIKRRGLDLTMRVPVSLAEAYNGATIDIPTFSGSVALRIPPRSQANAKLRLRGKGVARKGKRGDLLVVLDVVLPDLEDEALAKAIGESAASYTKSPRDDFTL